MMTKLQDELTYWLAVAAGLDYSQALREYAAGAVAELQAELDKLGGAL
jgi:hypothetical protein